MRSHQPSADAQPSVTGSVVPVPLRRGRARWRPDWLTRLVRQPKAVVGLLLLGTFVALALLAPLIAPYPATRYVAKPNLAPSAQHLLGTSSQGKDIFSQLLVGARQSLGIGFSAGALTMAIGLLLGMSAGYLRGVTDELLSLLINLFLIIPGLPLLITLSAFLKPGPGTIVLVIALTSWSWPARVFRGMTLALREKDFVAACVVSGERSGWIIFREILPNMASLALVAFMGASVQAILAEAGLAFLGLSNVSAVSWGTMLYWATNGGALLRGSWWTFVPAGVCIALVSFALTLINYAVDEVTNPRLQRAQEVSRVVTQPSSGARATPVVRDARA